jgi:transmembrane sensor
MNEETATYLIIQRIKGEITAEDAAKLELWLTENPQHYELVKKVERTWELSLQAEDDASVSFDEEADFNSILGKIDQKDAVPMQITHQRRSWLSVAAAVLFLLTAGGLYWKFSANQPKMVSFATKVGEKKDFVLPDGSHVWLNENTQISYPNKWDTDLRTVTCSGEAFFEVTKNAQHPFEVRTNLGTIRVLGTTFEVKQRSEENTLEVAVKEGKVQLNPKNSTNKTDLVAGDAFRYDATKQTISRIANPAGVLFAWQSGEVAFDAIPMSEVIVVLEQLYKITIKLNNPALELCTYSSRYATNLPLQTILKDICVVFEAQSRITGTEIEILGGNCKK